MASKILVNLDTSKEIFINSKCKQNDDLILEANIYENGLAKDLTNCSISIQALKADKTYIIQNTDIAKEKNKFIANLVKDFTRVAGKTEIEVVLTESSKQNTTFSFYIEVVGSVIKGALESSNTVTILENLQDKIEEAGQVKAETEQLIETGGAATKGDIAAVNSSLEQKANEADLIVERERINNIVAVKDSTDNLETADIRLGANGKTYGSAGEAVREQFNNASSQFRNFRNEIGKSLYDIGSIDFTLNNGKAYDVSSNNVLLSDSSYMKCTYINVKQFDRYLITTTSGNNWNGVLFSDANGKVLESRLKQVDWKTYTNYEVEVPTGAIKMYINCNSNYSIELKKYNYNNKLNIYFDKFDEHLKEIYNDIYEYKNIDYILNSNYGYDIKNNIVVKSKSNYMKCTELSVDRFDKYKITLTSGYGWFGIIFGNDNMFINGLLKQASWETFTDYEIEIPSGVNKIYINCNSSYSINIKKAEYSPIASKKDIGEKIYKYQLPFYYEDHLNNKITEIQKLEMESGLNGATYSFITDMHVNANPLNSFSLLERIRANTNAYHCFYGGDSCRAFGSEEYLRTDNEIIMNGLYNVFGSDISYVLGNHDFTICTGSTWGQDMKSVSTNAMYGIYNKKTGVTTKRLYHYWDDVENKIRHIIIDYTSINLPWFLTWLEETIKTTGEGWGLCFYTHVNMFNPNGEIGTEINYTNIINWICAIKNKKSFNATIKSGDFSHTVNVDYTDSKLDVIYVIWGHMHEDYAKVYNNVNFICTTCDACYNDDADVPREKGTVTEQAFDVIHINTNTKKVTFTRIGAGNSRDFTY